MRRIPRASCSARRCWAVQENLGERRCGAMAFSRDGNKVAFIQPDSARDATRLMVANVDGSDQRELTARPFAQSFVERSLAWSPDGSTIVVGAVTDENLQSHEIFRVDTTDGTVQPLTSLGWRSIHRIGWLGDGSGMVTVAVAKDSRQQFSQLWSVAYPTGLARRITSDLSDYASVASVSARDDALLAVEAHGAVTNSGWPPLETCSKRHVLLPARARVTTACMGSTGHRTADRLRRGRWGESHHLDDGRRRGQYHAGNLHRLRRHSSSVTADGRHLVFQSNRSGRSDIWRTDIDGGNAGPADRRGREHRAAHVARRSMGGLCSSRDGLRGLWRISIDGGEPVRLTDKPTAWPRVSPDGSRVAYGYRADRNWHNSSWRSYLSTAVDRSGCLKSRGSRTSATASGGRRTATP